MGIHFHKKTKMISIIVFLSFFFLGMFQNVNFTIAQNGGGSNSLIKSATIELLEYSKKTGSLENVTSIQIPLASSTWNVTSVDLNFSNIKGEREVKVIEDQLNELSQNTIHYKNSQDYCIGLATQLILQSRTTIYGVYIYGAKGSLTIIDATFQIGGYDEQNNIPNGTIWRTTNLNMSYTEGWYYQNFSFSPLTLPSGNYSLLINGTSLIAQGQTNLYHWYNVPYNPITPNLYRSEYTDDPDDWSEVDVNSTFLHKLDQKIISSYNPEDINLTAQINGDQYQVLNSTSPGEGVLSVPMIDVSPQSNQIEINFENNISTTISFDVNYSVSLHHLISTKGTVEISENLPNKWIINLKINRSGFIYYKTEMNYLSFDWIDVSIFKGMIDVTSPDFINTTTKRITIQNGSLSDDYTEWTIYANSAQSFFILNVPITTFQPSQELKFSISNPIPGNYTFLLFDPFGDNIYSNTIIIPDDLNQISYLLPSNAHQGIYNAYIFFFNGTHAGWQHQAFTINVPYIPDPNTPYIIIIVVLTVIFISAIAGMTSYQLVKRHKTKRERYRQKILNMYMDVFNLNYFMVLNRTSGLNVYELALAGKEIDPTLVSGFLQAIRTFGIELTDAEDQSQTIKLEFQNSKILMAEFRQFRLIFIMRENPSQDFINSIRLLSQDIDEIYGDFIAEFKGDRQHFKGIRELLERDLNISLMYPLKIVQSDHLRLKPAEKSIIYKAESIMKEKNNAYFYVSYLMADKKEFTVKTAEIILNLIQKKIFQPII